MHARMRRLVWSGDGTYVRRPWPARGKICACAFLVLLYKYSCLERLYLLHPTSRPQLLDPALRIWPEQNIHMAFDLQALSYHFFCMYIHVHIFGLCIIFMSCDVIAYGIHAAVCLCCLMFCYTPCMNRSNSHSNKNNIGLHMFNILFACQHNYHSVIPAYCHTILTSLYTSNVKILRIRVGI